MASNQYYQGGSQYGPPGGQSQYPPRGGQSGYPPRGPPPPGGPPQYGAPPGQFHPPPPGHPPNAPPPPMLPAPWHAEWDSQQQHFVYVNSETTQRTLVFPGPSPPAAPGYHTGPPPPQGYAPPPPGYGPPPGAKAPAQGHNWKDMAIGGAGGAVLGGFLTHEWDEHKEHRKEDQWHREERAEEDEISRLRRQNAEERRENQGLENQVYREEERRPMYGGGEYGRFEERRDFDDGYRDVNTEYIQRDDTFVDNTFVDERRGDDVVYEQRSDYVQDDYVQDDYVRDDYRQEGYGGGYQDDSLVDDAARWAGREEQRVDDVPFNIERKWDNVEDSFDQGRDNEAWDDGRY